LPNHIRKNPLIPLIRCIRLDCSTTHTLVQRIGKLTRLVQHCIYMINRKARYKLITRTPSRTNPLNPPIRCTKHRCTNRYLSPTLTKTTDKEWWVKTKRVTKCSEALPILRLLCNHCMVSESPNHKLEGDRVIFVIYCSPSLC